MGVYGNLSTMTLPDLLRWAKTNHVFGVLELERNRIRRSVAFEQGEIVACTSDDPPARLGQMLYSSGAISSEQLRDALATHAQSGKFLGEVLVDMQALTEEELNARLESKARETISGLFEWPDGIFRFHEGESLGGGRINTKMSVKEILINGLERLEELDVIRVAFSNSGIVLARTEKTLPAAVEQTPLSRRIIDSIDGKRALGEVLLHAHAPEFSVLKFLFQLYDKEMVTIADWLPVALNSPSLLDDPVPVSGVELIQAEAANADKASSSSETGFELDSEPVQAKDQPKLEAELEVGQRLLENGEYDVALDMLNACYANQPDDVALHRLIQRAEAAYIAHLQQMDLDLDNVPILLEGAYDMAPGTLSSELLYLFSLFSGENDIRTILWLAPLREIDVLKALSKMREMNLIELKTPAEVAASVADAAPVTA